MLLASDTHEYLETLARLAKEKFENANDKDDLKNQDKYLLIYGATKARLKSNDIFDELKEIKKYMTLTPPNLLKMSLIYKFMGEPQQYMELAHQALCSLEQQKANSVTRGILGVSLENFSKEFLGSLDALSPYLKIALSHSLDPILNSWQSLAKSPSLQDEVFLECHIKGINKLTIGLIYSLLDYQDESAQLINNLKNYQGYTKESLALHFNECAKKMGLTTQDEWLFFMATLKKNIITLYTSKRNPQSFQERGLVH
jgi:hypothetical protein